MLVSTPFHEPSFLRRLRKRGNEIDHQLSFLKRLFTPRSVFLHFGAGDCALALQAAGYVERVYAVDVAPGVTSGVRLPLNLRLIDSRDLWTIGDNSVDVGFSERLPVTRLKEIHRCLAPHGRHVFQSNQNDFEVLRAAGFHGVQRNFLANLLRSPRLLTAVK